MTRLGADRPDTLSWMASLEADIDRLYRLPLSEFTAARNELAPKAGDQRLAIKALQKPNTAAWAVNQLYWHHRKTYDRLIEASGRLRAAHARVLSGRKADVAQAEAEHGTALQDAIDTVTGILDKGDETASSPVLMDIRETLQALPSEEAAPGRLVRPLKPMGFGALLRMLPGGFRPSKPTLAEAPKLAARAAEPVGDAAARQRQREAERLAREAEKRARAERERERARLERELRQARQADAARRAALEKARDALRVAEREAQRRQAAVEEQKFEVRRLEALVATQEKQAAVAQEARLSLERDLERVAKR